ncbi:MAG: MoaD/ThiS family protein [Myxococcota bacterium]
MPKVRIPAPYRGVTKGAAEVAVDGGSVRECLDAVEGAYPGFRELLFEADGSLHRFTKLFHNGEPLAPDALDEPVAPQDEIAVMSPIAGG